MRRLDPILASRACPHCRSLPLTACEEKRRRRSSDPKWKIRDLLRCKRKTRLGEAFWKLWKTLIDLREPSVMILKTWIAGGLLPQVLTLAGTGADAAELERLTTRNALNCRSACHPDISVKPAQR